MTTRVSIGLAVYNGERFLRQTLDSILAQTFEDFELIISDNASTDRTGQTCEEYAANDGRIRYCRNPENIGMADNFNRVFRLSSADYYRWASADDHFERTSLAECVKVLDGHPEVVLCYPKTVLIDGAGNVIGNYDDNLDLRHPEAPVRMRLLLQKIGLVNAQYGLIRTGALRRTGLLAKHPGSDIGLLAELALHGQFWEIPRPLFFRRMHEEASSAAKNKSWKQAMKYWTATGKREADLYYTLNRLQNVAAVMRAPISSLDKLRSLLVVGNYAFRSRHIYFRELQQAIGNKNK